MWKTALETVTPETWRKTIEHTDNYILNAYNKETLPQEVESLRIEIGSDDSDEESDDFYEFDSD